MRFALFLGLVLLLPATPLRAAESLGVFAGWAAFHDEAQGKCYAIARPDKAAQAGTTMAYATIGNWNAHHVRGQIYFRLSRPVAPASRVYLSVGERRFALLSRGQDAWAQDARMDVAIIAAMRSTATMSVEFKARDGRAANDLYVLKGAATAMDAAGLACASG